jgi:integrase
MANIEKRGESYRFVVSCGYDVNGKQIKRSMTWKPEKKYTEKQLEKELQKQAALFEEKVLGGSASAGGNMKLVDFIPQYLENVKADISVTTFEKYERIIKTFIVPALGHLKLKDIKPLHVQKFVNALSTGDYRQDGKKEPYKPATVRRYYVVLQSIMHNAYRLQLIPSNPTDGDIIKLPSIGEQKTEIFTKQELSAMFAALENESNMFRCLIYLAIATGCRRGELVALEWSDIDFMNGTVSVSKSAYQITGQPTGIKDTKSHKSRIIKIPDICISLLKKWKSEQVERRFKIGSAWIGNNWIFIQDNGSILYPTSPTLMFRKFLKRHNLPHKKFHALRHTSATLALSNGVNIKAVGARLGHSQLSTTNRYVHAIEEAEKQAADIMENILKMA